jgi:prepilin-type N-terminal cleavage/methylation domain-containing protein
MFTTPRPSTQQGFTVIDMVVAVAIVGIISAIAVPTVTSAIETTRLVQVTREVERELQVAKSRAVGKGRVMRVRFNCPAAGMYRITELIGAPSAPAAADNAGNRCDQVAYPFPAADADPLTLPNHDGPIRMLGSAVTFGAVQTLEFWPDGTAHYNSGANPWQMVPVAGVTLTLTRKGTTSRITVNGIGRIQLQTN